MMSFNGVGSLSQYNKYFRSAVSYSWFPLFLVVVEVLLRGCFRGCLLAFFQ